MCVFDECVDSALLINVISVCQKEPRHQLRVKHTSDEQLRLRKEKEESRGKQREEEQKEKEERRKVAAKGIGHFNERVGITDAKRQGHYLKIML